MKKIVASVGLVALGASGIETALAQVLSAPDNSKPWSVSATLRGFYDDNTATIPNNSAPPPGQHRDSAGLEVNPSAAFVWSVEQTTLNLGVLYSLKYYQNTPPGSTDHHDQAFTFNTGLTHSFNERYKGSVNDSFVIGQEPDYLRAGSSFATFQRVSGDNIRNFGAVTFDAQLTPEIGVAVGYDNAYYDYKDTGVTITGAGVQPSLSGILNRIENRAHVEGLYQILPETKGLAGFQFSDFDYYSDQLIAGGPVVAVPPLGFIVMNPIYAKDRDNREYTGYLGVEHNFTPVLTGSLRAGASYTEYYNAPNADNPVTPYVNAILKYTYAPQSSVQGGFSYDRNPTDVIASGLSTVTLDAESAVVFASVNHRITPSLFGSLIGQFQNNVYHGGTADGKTEQFYLFGLELEYRFNQYLSAHAGYNYDNLASELARHYDRNRVYVGVTATY